MSGKTFYVYELIDPRNLLPFYIGKGTGKRMYQHVAMAKSNQRMNPKLKLRIMELDGNVLYNKIIETTSEFEAFRKEAELIEHYELENLCNVCKAGPNWSDMDCGKLRKSLSNHRKLLWQNQEYRAKIEAVLRANNESISDDERLKRSRRFKRMWKDGILHWCDCTGKHHTNESKNKISQARKAQGNFRTGCRLSESTRQKISESLRKRKDL
jgi:hypothetical protein